MTVFDSSDLNLPDQILDPWLTKVSGGSTVAVLSGATPMKFGSGESMIFDIGEAEYVAEGAQKSGSEITKKTQKVKPYKFHKTVRWTNEVMYADEDYQLGVVSQILGLAQPALSRALDFGVFHGIDPLSGDVVADFTTTFDATTSTVNFTAGTDKPYSVMDAADALVLASDQTPSDAALSSTFASAFSALRSTQTEQKLYPNLSLGIAPSELDGHRVSVNRTVAALNTATVATGTLGYVGDFATLRWGIQRAIGMELIEFGDPDGGGDLKRNNQVAFRVEVIYGWGIADLAAIARIKLPA